MPGAIRKEEEEEETVHKSLNRRPGMNPDSDRFYPGINFLT